MTSIDKIANQKKESRDIVNKIIDFGVTEDQKLDIIYFIALNLESNAQMKDICNVLKKHRKEIQEAENKKENNKIILS